MFGLNPSAAGSIGSSLVFNEISDCYRILQVTWRMCLIRKVCLLILPSWQFFGYSVFSIMCLRFCIHLSFLVIVFLWTPPSMTDFFWRYISLICSHCELTYAKIKKTQRKHLLDLIEDQNRSIGSILLTMEMIDLLGIYFFFWFLESLLWASSRSLFVRRTMYLCTRWNVLLRLSD